MRLTEPRIPPLSEANFTAEQAEIAAPSRERFGMVFNVNKTLMHNMPLFTSWITFARHIMAGSSLEPRLREIIIMRVGWNTSCEYEWGQHVLMSEPAGLTPEDHKRIKEGALAEGWSEIESVLITATDELLGETMISNATWAALSGQLNEKQITDVIFTVGQYQMMAMALNSLGVQREPGIPGFDG